MVAHPAQAPTGTQARLYRAAVDALRAARLDASAALPGFAAAVQEAGLPRRFTSPDGGDL
jgi:hypothetical protein